MNESILFSETQKFIQWWIWVLFIGINGTILFGIYQQLIQHRQFGNKPLSDVGLIIAAIFITLLSLSFRFIKLQTLIKADGIYVRFFPIHRSFRFYSWDSLSTCIIREYKPISEYGGWGIRGFGKNRALNVSGKIGLQLEFKDGKKILIGTNKSDQLQLIIQPFQEKNNI